eukprot:CAMPEP_0202964456 /NCGR_PEP_ID=MMETSP1396-20130829/8540_1 /ASSEMBLY_ACC=CAM_ASM_000872 /TAXON_ID= /ORGANISM="Pseudokeronopsis sp., Strain Brazil" /LENGTH=72 /DNA_ID=CAMNT_0049686571 /DNA_START=604 /DNA_END=822 /DNA_ORIENTATION=+
MLEFGITEEMKEYEVLADQPDKVKEMLANAGFVNSKLWLQLHHTGYQNGEELYGFFYALPPAAPIKKLDAEK